MIILAILQGSKVKKKLTRMERDEKKETKSEHYHEKIRHFSLSPTLLEFSAPSFPSPCSSPLPYSILLLLHKLKSNFVLPFQQRDQQIVYQVRKYKDQQPEQLPLNDFNDCIVPAFNIFIPVLHSDQKVSKPQIFQCVTFHISIFLFVCNPFLSCHLT